MCIFELNIDYSESSFNDELDGYVGCFISKLIENGQILNQDLPELHVNKQIKIQVTCPEFTSLDEKYNSIYANEWKAKIEEFTGRKIFFNYLGNDESWENFEIPQDSSSYIVYPFRYSPIICGDTLKTIPIYKFPKTSEGGSHYDLRIWWNDYKAIYDVWLNCSVNEKLFQRILQDYRSDLNKNGIELSKIIEKLTGKPTYYYLFNYRNWGSKKDRNQKCPKCGGDWLIENKDFNDFIAFRCYPCRLVSHLSSNS